MTQPGREEFMNRAYQWSETQPPGDVSFGRMLDASGVLDALAEAEAERGRLRDMMRELGDQLEKIANDVRAAGDAQVVALSADGVSPTAITLADELWLISQRLNGFAALDREPPDAT